MVKLNNFFLFQGNSSYTRPPPLTSSGYELYDSCVNDESNPSIYIVFERDQCYPKYLIKYRLRKAFSYISDQNANSSASGCLPSPMHVSISKAANVTSTTSVVTGAHGVQTCNPGTSYSSQTSHTTSASKTKQTFTSHLASTLPYQHSFSHSRVSNWNANQSTLSPVQPTTSVPCCTAVHMVSTTSSASGSNRILTCNVGTSCLSQRLHTTSASQTKQTSTSHSASALPHQRNSSHNKVSNWDTSPLTSSSVPTPTPEPCFSAARVVSTTSSVSGLPRIQKFNSGTSYSSQRSQMSLSSQTKQSSTSQSILKSPQTENNKKCSIQ